jgi:UDP-perosamine 4-acetyltransferase
MRQSLPHIILGAGGHAKVLLALVRLTGLDIIGVCDPTLARQGASDWRGVAVLGSDEFLQSIDPKTCFLINGIGQIVGGHRRESIFANWKKLGFHFPTLIHPNAYVDSSAMLGDGAQIMAGVNIQADVKIGQNCIVNTRASIDHDCVIEDNVHIAPGAVLCGGVHVGSRGFIAAGATVVQDITVGASAVVGAGVTLVRNLASGQTVIGPAMRKIK